MRAAAKVISLLALAGTILPACLYFAGTLDDSRTLLATNVATLAWFVATPMWMGRSNASNKSPRNGAQMPSA